jgi:hypothetical protein
VRKWFLSKGPDPMDVTRTDIDRIHQRLDQMTESFHRVAMDTALLQQKIESLPPAPVRPCPDFLEHLAAHKESDAEKRSVLAWVLQTILAPALAAAGGILAGLFYGGGHGK